MMGKMVGLRLTPMPKYCRRHLPGWVSARIFLICQQKWTRKKLVFFEFLSIFRLFCDALKAKHLTGTQMWSVVLFLSFFLLLLRHFYFLLGCAIIMIRSPLTTQLKIFCHFLLSVLFSLCLPLSLYHLLILKALSSEEASMIYLFEQSMKTPDLHFSWLLCQDLNIKPIKTYLNISKVFFIF